MSCSRCGTQGRIIKVSGKVSDTCSVFLPEGEDWTDPGYVPHDIGIGGGDYLEFAFCLTCGQMQGTFPVPEENLSNNRH
jgi:hypothetical protein